MKPVLFIVALWTTLSPATGIKLFRIQCESKENPAEQMQYTFTRTQTAVQGSDGAAKVTHFLTIDRSSPKAEYDPITVNLEEKSESAIRPIQDTSKTGAGSFVYLQPIRVGHKVGYVVVTSQYHNSQLMRSLVHFSIPSGQGNDDNTSDVVLGHRCKLSDKP